MNDDAKKTVERIAAAHVLQLLEEMLLRRIQIPAMMARAPAQEIMCPACLETLRAKREAAGALGFAFVWCEHSAVAWAWCACRYEIRAARERSEAEAVEKYLRALYEVVQQLADGAMKQSARDVAAALTPGSNSKQ